MNTSNVEEKAVVRLWHTREELLIAGSDLMRGSGQRVVSAWRHMAAAGNGMMAHEKLFDLIRSDIQSYRAGDHGGQPDTAAFVCKPYVNVARSYGEHWPLVALREFLRKFGTSDAEATAAAKEVWERELALYRREKNFCDGKAWNAAH